MTSFSRAQQSADWSARAKSFATLNRRPPEERHVAQYDPPVLIGESGAMKQLFSVIERIAPTGNSVLITGATGTGKELVARAIHEQSGRRGPFVGINCSTLPDTLVE